MEAPGLILLAAGASRRMGAAKQLLPYAGGTLLGHAVAVALATACRPVVVVVGANLDAVKAAAGRGVTVAENPDWADGMGTSIRCGLSALRRERPDVAEVLITLGDQPLVTAGDLTRLINARRAAGLPIAAAHYAGTLGVPACFEGSALLDLENLPPAAGAKRLLIDASRVAAVPMPTAEVDLDTPADVERLA